MTEELWLPLPGHEGRYEVSDQGRIASLRYAKKIGARAVLAQSFRGQYLRVEIKCKHVSIHCAVAKAFHGPCPKGHEVNHKDGVKTNNRASNLEYKTRSGNAKHSFEIGLQNNQGENHSRHKLTDDKVREIRLMSQQGMRGKEISKLMMIGKGLTSMIINRRRWAHVTDINPNS